MGNSSFGSFLKGFFYKLCFCLGLGMMGFYSFGQVQTWIFGDSKASHVKRSGLQSKVHALESQPSSQGVVEKIVVPVQAPAPKVQEVSNPELVVAEASPSPTATPSDVATNEAPKEGEAPKTEGELANNPDAGTQAPYPSYAQPVFYQQAQQESATPPTDSTENENRVIPSGQVGTGFAVQDANANRSVSGTGTTYSYSSHSNPVLANSTGSSSSQLTSQDLSILNTALKGSFAFQSVHVQGSTCTNNNGTNTCAPGGSFTLHTSRWSVTEGLSTDASLSVKANSATAVQVTLGLKIQEDLQGQLGNQTLSASVNASQISVRTDVRAGKKVRVFDFKLPDMVVRAGKDTLSNVQMTLAFDISGNAPMVSNDSALNFSRTQVTTVSQVWDSGPNRLPADVNASFVADSITYTMQIEKSP